jgi:hypothetical protein
MILSVQDIGIKGLVGALASGDKASALQKPSESNEST